MNMIKNLNTLLLGIGASAIMIIGLTTIPSNTSSADTNDTESTGNIHTAVFAGGCFWCIEADFEKLEGVTDVVSGYTGGSADTANYKTVTYKETGHYEAVRVSYDPMTVSYAELVEYFWRHIDPTDSEGQFCDKGSSYKSAIFYNDADEHEIVKKSLRTLEKTKPFKGKIATTISQATPFYLAEGYHQDYYKKNPIRYRFYRNGCGRDKRVKMLWGNG